MYFLNLRVKGLIQYRIQSELPYQFVLKYYTDSLPEHRPGKVQSWTRGLALFSMKFMHLAVSEIETKNFVDSDYSLIGL